MVKRSNKVLFIEGTSDDKNGDLGSGFSKLLSQKLSGKMPRIIMGNGISETVDKFKNATTYPNKATLIDLDGKGSDIRQGDYTSAKASKKTYHSFNSSDIVYFMVQKMEAWFLSQPEILKDHFKKDFNKIPFDHASKIESPDIELQKMTQTLKEKEYHKVRDGSRLLPNLNLSKLESSFTDVKELLQRLNS